jgi:hypothetical protein
VAKMSKTSGKGLSRRASKATPTVVTVEGPRWRALKSMTPDERTTALNSVAARMR